MLTGEAFQSNIGRFEEDIRILAEVNSRYVVKTLRDAPLGSTLYLATLLRRELRLLQLLP